MASSEGAVSPRGDGSLATCLARSSRLMTTRSEAIYAHPISMANDIRSTASRRWVTRPYRQQIALAVGSLVEDALAAQHRLRPLRIGTFQPVGRDAGAAGERAEVRACDFGIGMIEGIEGEIHRRSFALQTLPVMSQSMHADIVIANHLGSTSACYSVLQRSCGNFFSARVRFERD